MSNNNTPIITTSALLMELIIVAYYPLVLTIVGICLNSLTFLFSVDQYLETLKQVQHYINPFRTGLFWAKITNFSTFPKWFIFARFIIIWTSESFQSVIFFETVEITQWNITIWTIKSCIAPFFSRLTVWLQTKQCFCTLFPGKKAINLPLQNNLRAIFKAIKRGDNPWN